MTEQWKSIQGFEGVYEVSNEGRVRRLAGAFGTSKTRVLKPKKHTGGYVCYGISLQGEVSYFTAHRLVAQAFLGERPEAMTVNHIDGNKLNNRIENLEYITQGENNLHAVRELGQRIGSKHYAAVLNEVAVINIKQNLLSKYTDTEIGKMYEVSRSVIKQIRRGKNWKHIDGDYSPPPSRKKLTDDDVREIRKLRSQGKRQKDIAIQYGVSPSLIWGIASGRKYRNVL